MGRILLTVVLIACCYRQLSQGQTCLGVSNSGCQLGGTISTPGGVGCTSYTVAAPTPQPLCNGFGSGTVEFSCSAFYPSLSPSNPAPSTVFCSDFFDDCCTSPTPAPTSNPTFNPTDSPSLNPTKNPTRSPTRNPTRSPTQIPSVSPTANPTGSPVVREPGFFEIQENVYMVSGVGGGLAFLIVAALAFRAVRNRRRQDSSSSSGSPEPRSQPELRGKKGATPSMKVRIEQEVENSIFDWEKHIDKTSGEVYFFNPKTNESRWDPPEIVSQTIKNISKKVEEKI